MRLMPISLLLCLAAAPVGIKAAETDSSAINMRHPGVVALSEDKQGGYQYKSFPDGLMLYVYDGGVSEGSICKDCSSEWVPLLVSEGHSSEPLGDWTVVERDDGQRQWAHKGYLVYIRYHNFPPDAGSKEQGFHLLVP